jgi:hypothetical protein
MEKAQYFVVFWNFNVIFNIDKNLWESRENHEAFKHGTKIRGLEIDQFSVFSYWFYLI